MPTIIIAMALVLNASGANAAPIYLSCDGDWRQGSIGLFRTETIPISLDTDKGTVVYEETTLKIYRNTDVEIWAADTDHGLDMRLNRLTGSILISTAVLGEAVKIAGWSTFEGTCKPA
jgi:hypothetical protein